MIEMSRYLIAVVISGLLCGPAVLDAKVARPAVTMTRARTTALALVPGGRLVSAELETEKGKRVYSFDIRKPGKSGVEEVQIDAMTGKLVSHVHESGADEAKEKQAEQRPR